MSIVRELDELGAGAHLNGQAGVLIVADPAWFDAQDLKAAKPDLRRHLRTHPEAPCAERLREYLIDNAFERFAVAHRKAGSPPAAPSLKPTIWISDTRPVVVVEVIDAGRLGVLCDWSRSKPNF